MAVGSDWQPDHPKGVPVNMFTVAIDGNGPVATCPLMERTREIVVTYAEDGQSTVFRFQMKPRPSGSHKPATTIVGSGLKVEVSTPENPQITFGEHGKGQITHVQYKALGVGAGHDIDCTGPFNFVKIWQGN